MPLPGATVVIKGTTNGTTTNFDGEFSLKCQKIDILIFNFVGYSSQELIAQKTININLILDNSLENIVITGGIQRRNCSTFQNSTNQGEKRWIGANLFTRFNNIFRKDNKNPKYRFNKE